MIKLVCKECGSDDLKQVNIERQRTWFECNTCDNEFTFEEADMECVNKNNITEFNISGCIYTGENIVDVGEIGEALTELCDSKSWEFCGITTPLLNIE